MKFVLRCPREVVDELDKEVHHNGIKSRNQLIIDILREWNRLNGTDVFYKIYAVKAHLKTWNMSQIKTEESAIYMLKKIEEIILK